MALEQTAQKLGLSYRRIGLHAGERKAWRNELTADWASVERTILTIYEREGWNGHDGEGGLILSLIKAASFATLPKKLHSVFIESLYYHRRYHDERGYECRVDPADMLESVRTTTAHQIAANFAVMAVSEYSTPLFFQTVTKEKVLGLFDALGVERLHSIATIFAEAPYELRAGWPDLTLWRGHEVAFWEVKAPGDSMHASQKRLIAKILKPLGYEVGLIEVANISTF
ncbi:MAG TPA: VRR-NUC domain-containing protein [Rhizomicrobium sp.]|nr:VRR-NUC domain-containing protein [Rhizomicrobium sp.]